MEAILGPGDHPQQHILLLMVRGDLFWGTICGMTEQQAKIAMTLLTGANQQTFLSIKHQLKSAR